MQHSPLVSVICLCYNHEKYVEEALESVINQSYTNIELIIIDDCSTDNSKKVIEKWLLKHPTITFISNKRNLGNTTSFNKAVKFSKGEYIIDLATDDILLKDCVATQVETFKNSAYKNLGIVYGNVSIIDENNNFITNYYTEEDFPQSGDIYKMVISRSAKICSVSSMVKKKVFDTIGFYNEKLAYEDLDIWVKASRIFDFEYIPKILVQKRETKTNLTSHFYKKLNRKTRKLNNSSYLILKNAFKLNKTKQEHKALLKRINYLSGVTFRNLNFDITLKLQLLKLKTFFKSL